MSKSTDWTTSERLLLLCVIALAIAGGWISWQLWGWFIRLQCGVPL